MSSTDPRQDLDEGVGSFADMAVVARLAAAIRETRLDCGCESRLDETLALFALLERRRTLRGHLLNARHHREKIEAILFFLNDLDELEPTEQDHSVYEDIALLFDDISGIAREGASSMRQLSASVKEGREAP